MAKWELSTVRLHWLMKSCSLSSGKINSPRATEAPYFSGFFSYHHFIDYRSQESDIREVIWNSKRGKIWHNTWKIYVPSSLQDGKCIPDIIWDTVYIRTVQLMGNVPRKGVSMQAWLMAYRSRAARLLLKSNYCPSETSSWTRILWARNY